MSEYTTVDPNENQQANGQTSRLSVVFCVDVSRRMLQNIQSGARTKIDTANEIIHTLIRTIETNRRLMGSGDYGFVLYDEQIRVTKVFEPVRLLSRYTGTSLWQDEDDGLPVIPCSDRLPTVARYPQAVKFAMEHLVQRVEDNRNTVDIYPSILVVLSGGGSCPPDSDSNLNMTKDLIKKYCTQNNTGIAMVPLVFDLGGRAPTQDLESLMEYYPEGYIQIRNGQNADEIFGPIFYNMLSSVSVSQTRRYDILAKTREVLKTYREGYRQC